MNINEESLNYHKENKGKIGLQCNTEIKDNHDLSVAYTPGVAAPCLAIKEDKTKVYDYTWKGRTIAVVTDGSAVLGLGNIGPEAGLPVMEGKAMLFKSFADVDAIPICLDTQDTEEIIKTVKNIAPAFGGINLEDISAPRCFEIEKRLIEELEIPVFHDDQHGTAIAVCAGLSNALKLVGKDFSSAKFVINGAGSAGISIAKLILKFGAKNLILVDRLGAVCYGLEWLNDAQKEMAKITNLNHIQGKLDDVIDGADVFIGVSAARALSIENAKKMNKDAIVFAMANPTPEITPEEAKEANVRIMATGRSDYPNQINNVLVFPGLFKGVLAARRRFITDDLKVAVSKAIASVIKEDELRDDYIIPNAFDAKVVDAIVKTIEEFKEA